MSRELYLAIIARIDRIALINANTELEDWSETMTEGIAVCLWASSRQNGDVSMDSGDHSGERAYLYRQNRGHRMSA